MPRFITITSLFIATSAVTLPAQACDMHGGGFSFGSSNANWQAYNPQSSTTDPSFLGLDSDDANYMTRVPAEKPRPSFSSAANRAALIAKSRLAKKAKDTAKETSKDEPVKKADLVLDANR